MKYKQVTVKVAHDEADMASFAMIEAGSEGAAVTDGADVKEVLHSESNWDYYDKSLDDIDMSCVLVSGCFAENADISELSGLMSQYLGRETELSVRVCDSVDWENEWKKYYKPIDFGKIVVVPKWLDGDFGKPKVLIDPGMAFGTGAHESTGMCLSLLAKTNLVGKTVLDVGCGSGILGIASLVMGAKNCTFVDIDKQAVEATESNLRLNGLNADVFQGDLTEKCKEKADVVLANLTADILLRLKEDLPCVMHSGSRIIMSGIINERAKDVLDGFGKTKGEYTQIDSVKDGEWQAFMLERN